MAEEVKVTYETMYEVLRRESAREELQKIEETFLQDVQTYCTEKQKYYEDTTKKNDLFSVGENEKLHQQLSNIRRVIKNLYDRREKKILLLALSKVRSGMKPADAANLLSHEKKTYEEITKLLLAQRETTLYPLLNVATIDSNESLTVLNAERPVESTADQPQNTQSFISKVRFTKPVEAFIGKNLETLGPYSIGDTATLSNDIVEVLTEQGSVVKE